MLQNLCAKEEHEEEEHTRVVQKVLGLTMKKRIYNFKIIFIFQHNLP